MWTNKILIKKNVDKTLKMDKPIVFFDTETTGLSPESSDIIQFAGIKCEYKDGRFIEIDKLNQYIRHYVPEKIEDMTGISNDFLADKSTEKEAFINIEAFMNDCVVAAHNAPFDIKFVSKLYDKYGAIFNPPAVIDTLKISRALYPDVSHKLCDLIELYGITDDIKFHNAFEDVRATIKVFENELVDLADEEILNTGSVKPDIYGVSYWNGPRFTLQRIYVQNNIGTLYFDIYKKCWCGDNCEQIDMTYVEQECLRITNCLDIDQLAKWKGNVRC